ncbi:MAG: hypothetical protein ACLQIB_04425 [Isosphaeraceae bacterium]
MSGTIDLDENQAAAIADSVRRPYHILRLPLDGGEVFAVCAPKAISNTDFELILRTLESWRPNMVRRKPLTIEPEEPYELRA